MMILTHIDLFIGLILCMIATEAVTEIITTGKIFEPLRQAVARRALPAKDERPDPHPGLVRRLWILGNDLITCPYCSSVWVATLFALFLPGGWLSMLPWNNLLVKIFVVHRLSNVFHKRFEIFRRGRVGTHDLMAKLEVMMTQADKKPTAEAANGST